MFIQAIFSFEKATADLEASLSSLLTGLSLLCGILKPARKRGGEEATTGLKLKQGRKVGSSFIRVALAFLKRGKQLKKEGGGGREAGWTAQPWSILAGRLRQCQLPARSKVGSSKASVQGKVLSPPPTRSPLQRVGWLQCLGFSPTSSSSSTAALSAVSIRQVPI